MFSQRTNWHRTPNAISAKLEELRANGQSIIDLTVSNPTQCGFEYPEREILRSLASAGVHQYDPHPQGLLSAREAVCSYYRRRGVSVNPSQVLLTASTSEAYAMVFKLLCDVGDSILTPKPSYPLFEYLAHLTDVALRNYDLRYDGDWFLDLESIERSLRSDTKAIIIVNPHNPTGMVLEGTEYHQLIDVVRSQRIALIVDEVFADYTEPGVVQQSPMIDGGSGVVRFTLNGISKSIGLPQLKLAWIVVDGDQIGTLEAVDRLGIIADTFLSVNTPVQLALSEILETGGIVREQIKERVRRNREVLRQQLVSAPGCSLLQSDGGWCAVIHVPRIRSTEDVALELLEKHNVLVHPGYFYDFDVEGYIVVSLLAEERLFAEGAQRFVGSLSTTLAVDLP